MWFQYIRNDVGHDEYLQWAEKAGTEAIYTVNLGTGTLQDAADCVEYTNFEGGTFWSDLRKKNGHEKPYGVKTIVSMNPIMIDGTGMCGGCRVTVGGKIKFACVDGPEFDGHEVDFDELIRRNSAYKAQEQEAEHRYDCNLMKQAEKK